MVEQVMKGVYESLVNEFTKGYRISTEDREEMDRPCFLISLRKVVSKRLTLNRYQQDNSMKIVYRPVSVVTPKAEMYVMITRLADCLETITLHEGEVRGMNIEAEIIENELHFYIDYPLTLIKQLKKEDPMEELTIIEGVKCDERSESI